MRKSLVFLQDQGPESGGDKKPHTHICAHLTEKVEIRVDGWKRYVLVYEQ
jgi:hypothetical protein